MKKQAESNRKNEQPRRHLADDGSAGSADK
jgi:hypothetical protein